MWLCNRLMQGFQVNLQMVFFRCWFVPCRLEQEGVPQGQAINQTGPPHLHSELLQNWSWSPEEPHIHLPPAITCPLSHCMRSMGEEDRGASADVLRSNIYCLFFPSEDTSVNITSSQNTNTPADEDLTSAALENFKLLLIWSKSKIFPRQTVQKKFLS